MQLHRKKLSTTQPKCGRWIFVLIQKTLMAQGYFKIGLGPGKKAQEQSEVTEIKTALNLD